MTCCADGVTENCSESEGMIEIYPLPSTHQKYNLGYRLTLSVDERLVTYMTYDEAKEMLERLNTTMRMVEE